MNEFIIQVSDDKFKNDVNIKFDNILDGFSSYKNFTLVANNIKDGESKIISFIEKIFEENNYEVYIDFYITKLSPENKKKLFELIPIEDKNQFNIILNSTDHNGVFYKVLDKTLIPPLVRLNTKEIFFITFYFTNRPITIWGNYNLNFPCFLNTEKDFDFYYNIAKSFNLVN